LLGVRSLARFLKSQDRVDALIDHGLRDGPVLIRRGPGRPAEGRAGVGCGGQADERRPSKDESGME
jgi:hypothetical protein